MGRPVYILGAGFNVDFSPQQFPLATNFLKIAKEQLVYKPDGVHEELSLFITKYFGDDSTANLEKVLSYVASPSFGQSGESAVRLQLYDQLVMIIVNTLNSASATVAGRGGRAPRHRGPHWEDYQWTIYRRFADVIAEQKAIIITFNYDLLLEFILGSTRRWGMTDGYGIDIPTIYQLLPRKVRRPISALAAPSSCILLKLHGSINWGAAVRITQGTTPAGLQRQILRAKNLYRSPENLSHGILNFHTFEDKQLASPIALRPVVIPPVVDKSGWLKNMAIGSLWRKAAEAIRACEEIIIIGYSLPPTDFIADFLFRESFRNSSAKCVKIVSPDADELAETRFKSIFGDSVTPICDTFLEWAARTYLSG